MTLEQMIIMTKVADKLGKDCVERMGKALFTVQEALASMTVRGRPTIHILHSYKYACNTIFVHTPIHIEPSDR